jgi:hypothetical protein
MKEIIAVALTLIGVACGTGANVSRPAGSPAREVSPAIDPSTQPSPSASTGVTDPCLGETRVGYCGNTGGSARVITITSVRPVTITSERPITITSIERVTQTEHTSSVEQVTVTSIEHVTVTSVQVVTETSERVVTLQSELRYRDSTQIVSIVSPTSTRVITQSPGQINEWNITEPGTIVMIFSPESGSTQIITMNSVETITVASIQTVTLFSTNTVTMSQTQTVTLTEPGVNTTTTITDCPVVTHQLSFPLQPYSEADAALNLPLPYRTTGAPQYRGSRAHSFPLFELGSTQIPVLSNGLPSINNGQIRFKADLRVPRLGAIAQVLDTSLELDAVKNLDVSLRSRESHYLRTEIFCFLDARICSGEMTTASNYFGNYNPSFWGTSEARPQGDPHRMTFNNEFATQLLAGLQPSGRVNHRTRRIEYHNSHLQIRLDQQNSSSLGSARGQNVTLTDLIYGRYVRNAAFELVPQAQSDAANSPLVNRTLHMSVSDDTVILGGIIRVTIQGNSCTLRESGIEFGPATPTQ